MKTMKITRRLMGFAAAIMALTACSDSEDMLSAFHTTPTLCASQQRWARLAERGALDFYVLFARMGVWQYCKPRKKFNKSLVLSENGSFFFVLSFKNLIFGEK